MKLIPAKFRNEEQSLFKNEINKKTRIHIKCFKNFSFTKANIIGTPNNHPIIIPARSPLEIPVLIILGFVVITKIIIFLIF